MQYNVNAECRLARVALALLLAAVALVPAACKKPPQEQESVKRYHLVGKVISVDTKGQAVIVDHQAIPGFMDAMTMEYTIRDADALAKLKPQDKITGDLIVGPNGAFVENIKIESK